MQERSYVNWRKDITVEAKRNEPKITWKLQETEYHIAAHTARPRYCPTKICCDRSVPCNSPGEATSTMQTVTWLQRLTRLSTCLVIVGTSSLLLLLPTTGYTQQRFIVVEKLEDGTLTYRNYELKESRQVDLSDLVLSERLQRKDMRLPPPLDSMWQDIPDFKVIL